MDSTTTTAQEQPLPRRPLPASIQEALQTISWPLDVPSQPLQLVSNQILQAQRRGDAPVIDIDETVAVLLGNINININATTATTATGTCTLNQRTEQYQWARIATALLLLGHGYTDEAHNLLGPLSFPEALPYYDGPPVPAASPAIEACAAVGHAAVHRQEAQGTSEFGLTGHANAAFWAGSALRCGGEETLPLADIRRGMQHLAACHGAAATTWLQQALQQTSWGLEWDPRPLTALCEEIALAEISQQQQHPLYHFCEQACTWELRVLINHALAHLGFEEDVTATTNTPTTNQNNGSTGTKSLIQALPRTLEQAMGQSCATSPHAIVVTRAVHPFTIVHVNTAWETLCGYTAQEAIDGTFALIQGPATDTVALGRVVRQAMATRRPVHVRVTNYTKQKRPFANHLVLRPLVSSSYDNNKIEWLVGILHKHQTTNSDNGATTTTTTMARGTVPTE